MRTVIFLSGIMISNAIDKTEPNPIVTKFLAIVLLVVIMMDVIDFIRGSK